MTHEQCPSDAGLPCLGAGEVFLPANAQPATGGSTFADRLAERISTRDVPLSVLLDAAETLSECAVEIANNDSPANVVAQRARLAMVRLQEIMEEGK